VHLVGFILRIFSVLNIVSSISWQDWYLVPWTKILGDGIGVDYECELINLLLFNDAASLVGLVTRLGAGWLRNWGLILGWDKRFSLTQNICTCSGAYSALIQWVLEHFHRIKVAGA